MKYISTRNKLDVVSGAQAIVNGLSQDGGLYVPEFFPKMSLEEIDGLTKLDYNERAAEIISKYLPEISKEDLQNYASLAYGKFDGDPTPLVKLDSSIYILELWHGPTHAFKDIALTLLPYLLTNSKKQLNRAEKTLILVATSGDTGKAALEGFKDVEGTDVVVFYPETGVSNLQKLQMMTTTGGNVKVYGIKGNFDDAQSAVKEIFTDSEIANALKEYGYNLSSANSINFGRLVPQVVYYFSSYADLIESNQIKLGDKINFCVPSGNFGNILAGYYAKQMGLPINKLICASNKNNVLTDFLNNGDYSVEREFFKTSSPSMDILISSNLERLIFEFSKRNDVLTKERMLELKSKGSYKISEKELLAMQNDFFASYADETDVMETLDGFFEEFGYVLDPHTSVAVDVYNQYVAATNDETKTVIISTASPYKFVDNVLIALNEKPASDETKSLAKLEKISAMPIPQSLSSVVNMKKLHEEVIDKTEVAQKVISYISAKK